MKKKAAILTNKPISFCGGVERFNFYLDRLLRMKGYEVDIYHTENVPLPQKYIRRFSLNQLTYAVSSHARKRKKEYEIMISNGGFGWGLGHPLPDQRFYNIYHGTTAGLKTATKRFMKYRAYFLSRYLTDGFVEKMSGYWKTNIAVSASTRDEIKNAYGHEAVVVNNGVDVNHFNKSDGRERIRERYGIPLNEYVGLFAGRIDFAMKGIDRLLEVINTSVDVFWVLVISGDSSKIQHGIKHNKYKIIENVPYERMPDIYNIADFGLYLSRYEGNSYYLLEALACELPVIATSAGITREIYQDELLNKLYLPYGLDYPKIISDIKVRIDFLKDRQFSALVGIRGRQIIENKFSLSLWKKNIYSVLFLNE